MSESDCYVTLWLPSATCEKQRTKTVNNARNPVWNETFYYRIQGQVKVRTDRALFQLQMANTVIFLTGWDNIIHTLVLSFTTYSTCIS